MCDATKLCNPNKGLTCQTNMCACTSADTYWDSTSSTCGKLYLFSVILNIKIKNYNFKNKKFLIALITEVALQITKAIQIEV